jgi:predicted nucleotidyltransferase
MCWATICALFGFMVSRARRTARPESDVDLLVIADGGRDRYGRTAGDLSEEQEVDRDKIVLVGSALD